MKTLGWCVSWLPKRVARRETGGRESARRAGMLFIVLSAAAGFVMWPHHPTGAQTSPQSLKQVRVPGPPEDMLAALVQDKRAALELGKALFWDVRVGSDNKTACASCHFHAGADNRVKNQIGPGLLINPPDTQFDVGKLSARQGTNYTLSAADFPLLVTGAGDANDVIASQGVFLSDFNGLGRAGQPDNCTSVSDPVFHGQSASGIVNTRRVAPRNTPSVINAVFYVRNFWDGRASDVFNGIDPFGWRNPEAVIWKTEAGIMQPVRLGLPSSSLASQASGPPLSEFEMSCRHRSFAELGRKLLRQKILAGQQISPSDSVLGRYAVDKPPYESLVRRAFRPEFWNSPGLIGFTQQDAMKARSMDLQPTAIPGRRSLRLDLNQMEANFSLFFGVALQIYQATLVSDHTPFDRYMSGQTAALNDQQLRGMQVFNARCAFCHGGPEFSNASFSIAGARRIGSMRMADGGAAMYDTGFYNIGVRPTNEDPGVGGNDPFGLPLSETLMQQQGRTALLGSDFSGVPVPADARVAVLGAFKTPGLRNIELTGPYFHNGGKATLMQVMDFYARGGDFRDENVRLAPLSLTPQDKQDVVAFMLALTDERVRYERAPFDHPALCITDGHPGDSRQLLASGNSGQASDSMRCLPAVGAAGSSTPLQPFLGLDPFAQ